MMKHLPKVVGTLVIVFAVLSLASSSLGPGLAAAAPAVPKSTRALTPIVLRAGHGHSTFRVAPPKSFSQFRTQSATFTVNYIPAGQTNALGDSCRAWPSGSQAAFSYAASIWGSLLNSTVPIKINACWASLGEGVLGHSTAESFHHDFTGAPVAGTWYSAPLANALAGSDLNDVDGTDDDGLNGDADAEIEIAYSDNGISWYFGTDGSTPNNQYDFVSVVLHEIAHGLGFAGSMSVSGSTGSWGGGTGMPLAYDRFTENGSGQSLLSFASPSTTLGAQLTSDNLYFDGTNADAANGGTRPKLYAPSTWQSGSSYSHLDEIFNGGENALMTYSLDDGESVHAPGLVSMGILKDVGWTAAGNPPAAPSSLSATAISQTQINLSWTDNSDNETGFKIERSPDGSTGWTQVLTVSANITSTSNTGLTCGTTYYYQVRAYNADGNSGYSNTANATTSACPAAPNVGIQKAVIGRDLKPGDYITFTLTISNSGNGVASQVVVTDIMPSQVLSASYDSTFAGLPGTTLVTPVWNVGTLGIGQKGVITIYGRINPALGSGFSFVNMAIISDPQDNTPGNNTSSVTVGGCKVYLPLIARNWPPVPDTPTLNSISNADGDGNYTVSWNAAARADTYTLQEANNSAFSSPTTRYTGASTSWSASNKPTGTYYYRVKATNSWGDSGWSTTQSAVVASGPTPGFWESIYEEFYVSTDRAYVNKFAVYVAACGNYYKITHNTSEPISNDHFSFSGTFYASGTFNSSTSASGTDGLNNFYIAGCGYVKGGPWSWSATWQNSSQPTLQVHVVEPETVEPVTTTGNFYVVTLDQ